MKTSRFLVLSLFIFLIAFSLQNPITQVQIHKINLAGEIEQTYVGEFNGFKTSEAPILFHGETELIIPENNFDIDKKTMTEILLINSLKSDSVKLYSGVIEKGNYEIELSNLRLNSQNYSIEIIQGDKQIHKLTLIVKRQSSELK